MGNLFSALNSAGQSLAGLRARHRRHAEQRYQRQQPRLCRSSTAADLAGLPVQHRFHGGWRSGSHPGHPQHLCRHGGAAATVAAGDVSAASNHPGAAAKRFRRLFHQPHSFGAESVVPKLFAMEYAAGQRELPVGGHRRGPADRQRVPASRGPARPNPNFHQQRYSVHGRSDQSGCRRHPVLQPAGLAELAARCRIERATGKHARKSFQPGQRPGAQRRGRHGHGAARRPDPAGGRHPSERHSGRE